MAGKERHAVRRTGKKMNKEDTVQGRDTEKEETGRQTVRKRGNIRDRGREKTGWEEKGKVVGRERQGSGKRDWVGNENKTAAGRGRWDRVGSWGDSGDDRQRERGWEPAGVRGGNRVS
ncbi:hypothetical protein Pmani_006336 [Petrolisthes manimaculis]|uniref:Uncharacterized protein n=1 Tax=Petrolisthes manimaculis TaxID=1843537 RepID=A0AAE1UFT3_9EUCA|nr:hypothetical protein Pmani_006336 [Petrolisthes manimaculis]